MTTKQNIRTPSSPTTSNSEHAKKQKRKKKKKREDCKHAQQEYVTTLETRVKTAVPRRDMTSERARLLNSATVQLNSAKELKPRANTFSHEHNSFSPWCRHVAVERPLGVGK